MKRHWLCSCSRASILLVRGVIDRLLPPYAAYD
jgi:hypothetical protein